MPTKGGDKAARQEAIRRIIRTTAISTQEELGELLGAEGFDVTQATLEHELRNRPESRLSAHLLIPGFVFTPLAARGRTEKPAGAWTPEQTVDFMLERVEDGDFYILCPDNEVTRDLDERRILWAAGDIVENRPPLSRWHSDYKDAFEAFLRNGR